MKRNVQKILLSLYTFSSGQQLVLSLKSIRRVVPDMSEGGFRSLLLFIERKGWIVKESLPGSQYISLSHKGREALKVKFPALNESWAVWTGQWQALVCIQAPTSDLQFRYLRQKLTAQHAFPLSRGVYLSANGFSQEIVELCRSLYQDSVVIFSVGEWSFGLERPIITKYYDLASVVSVYSSISTTIDSLLVKFVSKKDRMDRYIYEISTAIDRLCGCLSDDPGFSNYYFPGVPDATSVLPKIQQLLQL